MSDMNRVDSSNLDAIRGTDGVVISANRNPTGATPLTTLGCTLASGTTYFVPFGAQRSPVPAETPWLEFQLRWDAAVIFTATWQSTNWAATFQGGDPRGPAILSDVDTTPGFWLPETAASLPAAQVLGSGAGGATYTPPSLAIAGGTAGGAIIRFFNYSSRRGRAQIVVAGTGGLVRFGVHGKVAA